MKITWWEHAIAGFWVGVISLFLTILPLLPNDDDPTRGADFTTRESVLLVGVFLIFPALVALNSFITAWRQRKNQKSTAIILAPGIFSLLILCLTLRLSL